MAASPRDELAALLAGRDNDGIFHEDLDTSVIDWMEDHGQVVLALIDAEVELRRTGWGHDLQQRLHAAVSRLTEEATHD